MAVELWRSIWFKGREWRQQRSARNQTVV